MRPLPLTQACLPEAATTLARLQDSRHDVCLQMLAMPTPAALVQVELLSPAVDDYATTPARRLADGEVNTNCTDCNESMLA
jgi:hypothetical protein